MKLSKRIVAGLSGTVLAASALMIVGASPASATTPTGGCWVYSPTNAADIEDTVPASSTSTSLAPWADTTAAPIGNADYVLTSSGSTVVGGTRNFSLVFNKGPKNGGPPASGTVYYYFSVNGVNLPAVSKSFSAGGAATIPGDTITGSFPITSAGANNVVLRKVYYDIPSFLTRVACNGQSSGTAGTNPATTPLNTNITNTFTASGPTATISAISNQVVTTAARKNDVISFSVSNFTAAGTGTASLCDSSGANCDTGTSSVTIAGDGTGTGTLAVGASPATGARTLKVVSAGETSLTSITILANPTITIDKTQGGAGTSVGVTGSNWDPNQTVTLSTNKAQPPPNSTTDPTVTVTANASGDITGSITVNDPLTGAIGASRTHAAGPPPVLIFTSKLFTFNGDDCLAKIGSAATGSCFVKETLNLQVNPGDLKMSKVSGAVTMSPVSLNGTAQHSTGSLQDVTVMDYRGGTLGWTLVGRFSGFTGPTAPTSGNYTIPSSALAWTPSCVAGTNNDDTLTAGTAAASFATATTDLPLCEVTGVANLGADLTSGGNTTADAALDLTVPANQAIGPYSGILTLTLS